MPMMIDRKYEVTHTLVDNLTGARIYYYNGPFGHPCYRVHRQGVKRPDRAQRFYDDRARAETAFLELFNLRLRQDRQQHRRRQRVIDDLLKIAA